MLSPNRTTRPRTTGFTIVELLIVIVVIGILAAITVVAYSGIQNRAVMTRTIADLTSVNTGIQLYYTDHGSYPSTSMTWSGNLDGNTTNYVPSLAPTYIAALPVSPFISTGGVYMYMSDGINYKLIAHSSGGTAITSICPSVKAARPDLISNRDCWAYGFWSSGADTW